MWFQFFSLLTFISKASENEIIWATRISMLGVGALAAVGALTVNSIYELFYMCSDLMYVVLFPQLLCVIYVPIVNTYGSITGFVAGLFFRVAGGELSLGLPPLITYPWYNHIEGQLFPFKTMSMLITLVSLVLVSLLAERCFGNDYLPASWDVFRCFVKSDRDKEPNSDDTHGTSMSSEMRSGGTGRFENSAMGIPSFENTSNILEQKYPSMHFGNIQTRL